jgi:hypothetical protein
MEKLVITFLKMMRVLKNPFSLLFAQWKSQSGFLKSTGEKGGSF